MESQKETTVSLEEIEASSRELMELAQATAKTTGKKSNFKRQANALVRKHASFYKRSWTTLVVQIFIPILFMMALFGTSSPEEFKFRDDPHPLILPPQVPFQPRDPVRFTIPYVSSTSLGQCCQTKDGFLGLVSFDVLNSTIRDPSAVFPYSLGDFPSSDYTFERFNTNDELFDMMYDTTKSGWLAAYLFETMDFSANKFHIGYLKNISEYGARGSLAGINLIDNAVLAATTSPSNSLTVRLKKFPSWDHTLEIAGSGAAGTWVLLGCSFFMVPILALIVREKQDRLRNLLVLAGMRVSSYWIVLFAIGLTAYFILMLFWIFLGVVMSQVAFTHIAVGALIFLFFVYAFNQVGFAFFLSTFCDDEPTASLGGYTWILFFVILTQSIVAIIVDLGSDTEMYGVSVLPPFAVTVVVNAMSTFYFPSGGSMTMEDFYDHRASMALLILFLVGVGFFIVHAYLDQVYPAKYGIAKHPLFFLSKYQKAKPPQIKMPKWCPTQKKVQAVSHTSIEILADAPDVAAERSSAVADYNSPHPNHPLVIPGISKTFVGNGVYKVAVDDLPLLVSHLECFGLLGPNGGGKTTLVNILSGLYPTTSGDGKIKGHSVVEDLAKAQRHMGVCPQDCVLWKELSAREHLLLFGRLRNLRGEELNTAVNLVLKQVLLTDAADRPCGGYSGGMKRRLSLAISLIGCPPVVLLDEPTTGVDPFSRHVVWDTIRAYKHYCTIVLITHNMEEADALCERVGMISEGRMACVGRPSELKVRYNVGYSLTILHSAINPDNIISLVESIVKGAQLLDTLPGSCLFSLPKANTRLSLLFAAFQEQSDSLLISDWAVLPSNLEDVLIKSTHKEM